MNTTKAILIIQYTQARTRAWNFLSTRLKGIELTCLAESGVLQILSVETDDTLKYLQILDLLRDDIGTELKSAYWFQSPEPAYHLHGDASTWITDYSTL
jgi:hypothetical protein